MKKKWIFAAAAAVLVIFSLLFIGFFLHAQAEYQPPGKNRMPKKTHAHIAPAGTGYTINPSQRVLLKKTDAPPPKTARKTPARKKKSSKPKKTKLNATTNRPRTSSAKASSSPGTRTKSRSSAGHPAKSAAGSIKNTRSARSSNSRRNAGNQKQSGPVKDKNNNNKKPRETNTGGSNSAEGKKSAGKKTRTGSNPSKKKTDGRKSDPPAEKQPDDGRPIITTDLVNGQKVSGTTLLFSVSTKDAYGDSISSFDITVTLNGTRITTVGASTYRTEKLRNGKNTIKITAADNDGNRRTITRTVNCDAGAEAAVTGTATVRIEAATLSLGKNGVLSSGSAPVHQSDMISDVVISYLEKNGFTYKYTGGYLASIGRPGIAAGASVPQALLKAAGAEDPFAGGKTYSESTLAEKQFTSQSGWMFSVNDSFPEKTGMSGVKAKAKQKIRLCYTLFGNGADVDGRLKW